jgi:hypothetical protein
MGLDCGIKWTPSVEFGRGGGTRIYEAMEGMHGSSVALWHQKVGRERGCSTGTDGGRPVFEQDRNWRQWRARNTKGEGGPWSLLWKRSKTASSKIIIGLYQPISTSFQHLSLPVSGWWSIQDQICLQQSTSAFLSNVSYLVRTIHTMQMITVLVSWNSAGGIEVNTENIWYDSTMFCIGAFTSFLAFVFSYYCRGNWVLRTGRSRVRKSRH